MRVCGRGLWQDDETALSLLETVGLTELAKRYTLDDAEVSLSRHTPNTLSQPDGRRSAHHCTEPSHLIAPHCTELQSEIKCAQQLTARWLVRVCVRNGR